MFKRTILELNLDATLYWPKSPDQARFLAKVDNEKERVQASDTMSSEIKVQIFIHQLLAIGNNFLLLKINTHFVLAEFMESISFFDIKAMPSP